MKHTFLALSLPLLTLSQLGYSDSFQFELGTGYSQAETEVQFITGAFGDSPDQFETGDIETDGFSFFGNFFFAPVSTEKGPLDIATFLDKASGVQIVHSDLEQTIDIAGETLDVDHPRLTEISTRIVLNDRFIVLGQYQESSFLNSDESEFTIGGGLYIGDRHDVTASYAFRDFDLSNLKRRRRTNDHFTKWNRLLPNT